MLKQGPDHFNEKFGTWTQAMKTGIEKEYGKYARFKVYDDAPTAMAEAKKVKDAQFVRVGLIYYIKNYEMGREAWVLGVRLVVYGNHQWDAAGIERDGIEHGELLWSATPSLATLRTFVCLGTMLGNEISSDDYVAAYLHAPLRGPPVFFILPQELEVPAASSMAQPVHRARRAAYGQRRAGFDYAAFARDAEDERKWRNVREFDADASVTVRGIDGERLADSHHALQHAAQEHDHDWHTGARLGEASNPGPIPLRPGQPRQQPTQARTHIPAVVPAVVPAVAPATVPDPTLPADPTGRGWSWTTADPRVFQWDPENESRAARPLSHPQGGAPLPEPSEWNPGRHTLRYP